MSLSLFFLHCAKTTGKKLNASKAHDHVMAKTEKWLSGYFQQTSYYAVKGSRSFDMFYGFYCRGKFSVGGLALAVGPVLIIGLKY